MKPLLNSVEAVLFDLDGTLVETNIDFPLMKREVVALAVEAGMQANDVQRLDILGVLARAADFLTNVGRPDEASRLVSRGLSILEEIELRHARGAKEIGHARDVLQRLRDRAVRIGIVTRNCRAASEISLGIAGIQADVLVCREDSNNHKPHPEPVLLALGALGAEPRNSIMVGDHIMDVQAGKAAGMKTIGFLREDRPRDFFDDVAPDIVVRDLQEALGAIIGCDS